MKGYTNEQKRVCDYLTEITNGEIGCGPDPIGFLIASHAAIAHRLKTTREGLESIRDLDEDHTKEDAKGIAHTILEWAT